MKARLAPVVSLDAARARRRAGAPPAPPPTYIAAEPGRVLLHFSDGAELELAPEHARAWAERLEAMAAVAEALGGKGGHHAI